MRKNEEMSEMIDIAEHQTSFHDNSILMNSTLALSPTQDTHAPTSESFSDDSTVSGSSSIQCSQTLRYLRFPLY